MEKTLQAVGLNEKYGVTSEYLKSLSEYLNPEQIDNLLGSVGESAGNNKPHAYRSLPKIVGALKEINSSPENTVSVLIALAETSKEETGLAFETFSEPTAAKALHDVLKCDLLWHSPVED